MADENLERRVERLESQLDPETGLPAEVQAAREDAAAARHLSAANDRDVADLHTDLRAFRHATNASFNALRADFADLRTEFGGLRAEFGELRAEMRAGFADHEVKIDSLRTEMRTGFATAAADQQQLVGMLTTLIEQDPPKDG